MTEFAPTAAALAEGVARGKLDPVALVEAALARIEATDGRVRAWAHVDGQAALKDAAARRDEARAGQLRGPLHGVPFGVKDVFHAEGMPTIANSRTMDGEARYPDSGIVTALKSAGAVLIGKCTTVEFAGMGEPPQTRNPWNLEHTAGGSSSGSGAAVGAATVPLAIGTQTGGSNLRPAAYCGIAGLKPTYGTFSRKGLLPVSWSLDHPGIIARGAADLALAFGVMAQRPVKPERRTNWRLGMLRQFFFETSKPETATTVTEAIARLGRAGAEIGEIPLPPVFAAQRAIHRIVMNAEMVTYHANRLGAQFGQMTPRHALNVKAFSLIPANYYLQALRARRLIRDAMAGLFDEADILVMPTAPGPAPKGIASTGDASLLGPWSLTGFPSATVPCGLVDGLPVGLQLVGPPGQDERVIAAAQWAEGILGRLDLPTLTA